MKRIIFLAVLMILLLTPVKVGAAVTDTFKSDVQLIEDSIPDSTAQDMQRMKIDSVDEVITHGVDAAQLTAYIGDLLKTYIHTPLSVLFLLTAVIVLSAIGESYTYSLRYTDTKEVMNVAVSLYVAAVAAAPAAELIVSASQVIQSVSHIMNLYLPVLAAIMAFSGHIVSSAGLFTAVIGSSQVIAWMSSSILIPLLQLFLSLSISAGICVKIKISRIIELTGNWIKWILTFMMTVYTAVIGMNAALFSAGDSVAGRSAKFALSSFVPLIGSSIAEAYQTLKGSLDLLRSGLGVFVIVAIFITFAPLLIKVILWSLTLSAAKMVQDVFSVSAASSVLGALTSFMNVMRAIVVAVMTVFIISSAILIRVGGAA